MPPGSLTLRVRVKPRSRVERLTRAADGTLIARVQAPPVDGCANQAVVALLATKALRLPKGAVAIAGGAAHGSSASAFAATTRTPCGRG